MHARKVFLIVLGSLVALASLGLFIGGAAALAFEAGARGEDGYYQSSVDRYATPGYALVSETMQIGRLPGDAGTIRVRARSIDEGSVFVGVAPQRELDAYLSGVPYDEINELPYGPMSLRYTARNGTGGQEPALPADQTFWLAQASGPGTQTMTWKLSEGDSAIVVMNADASRGVSVAASGGIDTPVLVWIGLVALAFAVAFGVAAGGLLYAGLRGESSAAAAPASAPGAPAAAGGTYPARLDGHPDFTLSRGLWLVKWFLAIPHFFVLAFLWIAAAVLTVVAFFGILFTGRYPRRIFDFNVGVVRWTWRVTFYAFVFGTDRYPPFSLEPDATYPASFDVDYPERLSRGLVLVKWWLLAIPHYIIVGIFGGGAVWWGTGTTGENEGLRLAGFGLIGILALVAGVVILFSKRYPQSVFDFVMGMERWTYRVTAYTMLMRDEYPPFRLDNGGSDPVTLPPSPPLPMRPGERASVGGGPTP